MSMLFDHLTLGMVSSVGHKGLLYEVKNRNMSCLQADVEKA